jgi:predicted dehydrogenase
MGHPTAKSKYQKLKVGIIGAGQIARKAHIPAYRSLGAEVVAIADLRADRARKVASEFSIENWFQDYSKLLAIQDIDIVSVCTPPFSHCQVTIDAARARKHILVEKPMALSSRECTKMIEACRKANVELCVAHNQRYVPSFIRARQAILSGRIGRINTIFGIAHDFMPLKWTHEDWGIYDWGLLDDLGPHMVDAVYSIAKLYTAGTTGLLDGHPEERKEKYDSNLEFNVRVFANDRTDENAMGVYNQILALVEFGKSKTIAALDLSWASGTYERRLSVSGSTGSIDVDLRNDYYFESHGYITPLEDIKRTFRNSLKTAVSVLGRKYFNKMLSYHRPLISDFLQNVIRVEDVSLHITGEEGRDTVAIIEEIKKEYQRRNKAYRPTDFNEEIEACRSNFPSKPPIH